MPADIVRTVTCRAPRDVAFGFVADHRTVPTWVMGVERFDPVGDQTRGVGAEFDVTARFGVRLHTHIRVVEWVDGEVIALESVRGVHVRARFSFADVGADGADGAGTRVSAEVVYRLPRGPAGKVLERAVNPVISRVVDHANHALVAGIERRAPAG